MIDQPTSPATIIELENAIVRSVAVDIRSLQEGELENREWVYLAVNHEILIEEGRRSSTQASVLARRPGAELEDLDFRLSRATKQLLLDLRDAMSVDGADPWTITDIRARPSGKYMFSFSQD